MPDDPCPKKVSDASDQHLSESEASDLLARMQRLAQERARNGENYEDALKDTAEQAKADGELFGQLELRANLLGIRARRNIRSFVKQFPTLGEGLRAFMEGSSKLRDGARLSVSTQEKVIHGQYLGGLIAELERQDLLTAFKHGDLSHEIYIEMGELGKEDGLSGSSGSKEAAAIAKIIETTTSEMVARQNRAGAYINRLPGYIVRQTHDMDEIRRAGGLGNSKENRSKSLEVWKDFTLPLLDTAKTFKGQDANKFMRNVHESLYTGVHGPHLGEFESMVMGLKFDLSKQVSKERVLHFKDADAAFKYNERFGTRNLRDQVFSDVYYRARSIALMENFGPRVEESFDRLLRELKEEGRAAEDAGTQVDSLNDRRIEYLFDTITGKTDVPKNHSLAKAANVARAIATLSKMGATVISALSDKVFMNSEFAWQGMKRMDYWSKQITGMTRTPEETRMLRLMGVAMDGIIGNTVARYTTHQTVAGKAHRLQQKFFDLNFLNWWTDTNKGAAAELMSAHLAEHADLKHADLPNEIGRALNLYSINELEWDILRKTVWKDSNENAHITPDQVELIPDSQIDRLLKQQDLKETQGNRNRARQDLETSLRAYFSDRVDIAVPTPGAETKKWTTLGTRAGTIEGEAVRMLMMFKSFPIAVLGKIMGREIYGTGSESIGQWILNNHKGKFHTAQLIAMTIVAGYMSGAIRDALKGRTPKKLIDDDGKIIPKTLMDAASRGGGLGILGDFLFNEYDKQYQTLTGSLAGPVLGQLDPIAEIGTMMKRGEYDKALDRSGKFFKDNSPYINLFYLRPILDYFVFWNLQEMMDPGSLKRVEEAVQKRNNQGYFLKPSETVR